MIRPSSRRALLTGASATAAAAMLGGCDRLGNVEWFQRILRTGEDATCSSSACCSPTGRWPRNTPRRHLPWFKPNGTDDPPDRDYKALAKGKFAKYHLEVGGLVEAPYKLSLAELRKLPVRTQITRHDCVEGWSAIVSGRGCHSRTSCPEPSSSPRGATWFSTAPTPWTRAMHSKAGVTVRRPTKPPPATPTEHDEAVGRRREQEGLRRQQATGDDAASGGTPVRYYESIDLVDAFHPQTILAYEMNGEALPVSNGAPLRLRVERNLGYKQAKYVMRIEVVEGFAHIGGGKGGYWEDQGYAWYAGI